MFTSNETGLITLPHYLYARL